MILPPLVFAGLIIEFGEVNNSINCEATLIFKFGIKLNNNVMTSVETWACAIKQYGFVIYGEWTNAMLC